MRIDNAGNSNYQMNVPNKAAKTDNVQQFSASEIKEKMLEKSSTLAKEAPQLLGFRDIWTLMPEGFTDEDAQDIASLASEGKNARDWLEMLYQSGRFRKIPEVVYDIQAKNPYDERYYNIYITDENDNKIRCRRYNEAGTKVWELDISDKDREKINDYFKQFKPCPWDEIAYFDNDNGMRMGRMALKEFWLELLEK